MLISVPAMHASYKRQQQVSIAAYASLRKARTAPCATWCPDCAAVLAQAHGEGSSPGATCTPEDGVDAFAEVASCLLGFQCQTLPIWRNCARRHSKRLLTCPRQCLFAAYGLQTEKTTSA